MASIREAARNVLDVAQDRTGWIACWKEGRSWAARAFWPNYDERTGRITLDSDDTKELREIIQKDGGAILVNAYVHNLGVFDDLETRDGLANALKWQYRLKYYLAADAIA